MFSLVSVYNNPAKLEARLRAGLARQQVPHQLICVDNRAGRFSGAAAALNEGARQAEGEWIIFLHQDVELLGHDWLARADRHLAGMGPEGWHGVVGRTASGRWRGLIRDRAMIFGEPFDAPVEVQTLDEIVLIHRNGGADYVYFDDGIPGWHAYGVEACCAALRRGGRNSVLPLPVWHDSNSTNQAGLRQAHQYVWQKHRDAFSRIYTTCGVLPHPYGWSGSYKIASFCRGLADLRYLAWRRWTQRRDAFTRTPWEVLEELTSGEEAADCLHRPMDIPPLVGCAFTDRTNTPRRITHHFAGLRAKGPFAACLVIAPDLALSLDGLAQLPPGPRRVIVCLYLDKAQVGPEQWRRRLGRPFGCNLAVEADGTRWAILDFVADGDTAPIAAERGSR
jgi:Glycosyl transferase family 2